MQILKKITISKSIKMMKEAVKQNATNLKENELLIKELCKELGIEE